MNRRSEWSPWRDERSFELESGQRARWAGRPTFRYTTGWLGWASALAIAVAPAVGVMAAVMAAVMVAGCGGAVRSSASGRSMPPSPGLPAVHERRPLDDRAFAALVRRPTGTLRQELTLALRDGRTGRGFQGRGVLAVRVGEALRLIVLGPGGTTALDVWLTSDRYRVGIPALGKVVRGVGSPRASDRALPVDLLRRWILDPFGGERLHVSAGVGGSFVSFARRGDVLEVRSREPRTEGAAAWDTKAWWYRSVGPASDSSDSSDSKESVVGWVEGQESPVIGDPAALFPTTAVEESVDPPMRVEVRANPAERVDDGLLPSTTFVDPDQAEEPS